ncbi:MAG: hypothetical protein Q7S68_01430 [Deltaproteobacteria bacterium]|nr:hypothetical protein [Deltaproteobacteria bacterium]
MKLFMPKKVLLLGLVLAFALLYAWSRVHVVELGYAVSRLKGECEELERSNGLFRSKVAKRASTEELVSFAQKFGMVPPRQDQIIFMEDK